MNANDIGIKVIYRNRDMTPTYSKTYTLNEYTDMLRADLLRLVTDIEDLCYTANSGNPKEEWTEETFTAFNKIKHKLLDKAGDIGRIPENIVERVHAPMNEFIAALLGNDGEVPDNGESCLGSD